MKRHFLIADSLTEPEKVVECKRLLSETSAPESRSHAPNIHSEKKAAPSPPSIRDLKLWLAAITSIVVISLCGVFGVLVIPIMQKVFYQHLIQFLVALAIGSMLGDALLHLIPHALAPGSTGKQ